MLTVAVESAIWNEVSMLVVFRHSLIARSPIALMDAAAMAIQALELALSFLESTGFAFAWLVSGRGHLPRPV